MNATNNEKKKEKFSRRKKKEAKEIADSKERERTDHYSRY
jgi:hypothetical protein